MKVNLKILGLALVAALAMSAVVASAAQAENAKFTAEKYPAVAKGSQEGNENYFEITSELVEGKHVNGERTECAKATYEGTLGAASTELTVTPHYSECGGKTIHLNGCDFRFKTHGTEVSEGEGASRVPGTADVVCPKDTTIEVTGPLGICQIHVPAQTGLEGVTFTNITPTKKEEEEGKKKHVTVDVNITTQIHYIETDTAFCPFGAEPHTTTDGNFVSKVTVEGYEDKGEEKHPTTNAGDHPRVTYKLGAKIHIDVK